MLKFCATVGKYRRVNGYVNVYIYIPHRGYGFMCNGCFTICAKIQAMLALHSNRYCFSTQIPH